MGPKLEPLMLLLWHFYSEVAGKSWSFKLILALVEITRTTTDTIFFSPDSSLKDKLRAIAKATYTHSRNLAYFVFTYKGLQALQEKIQGKSLQSQSFLAACIGGWLVFGDNNNINSQVGFGSSPHMLSYHMVLFFSSTAQILRG